MGVLLFMISLAVPAKTPLIAANSQVSIFVTVWRMVRSEGISKKTGGAKEKGGEFRGHHTSFALRAGLRRGEIFCRIFDSCVTYERRETSIIGTRPVERAATTYWANERDIAKAPSL